MDFGKCHFSKYNFFRHLKLKMVSGFLAATEEKHVTNNLAAEVFISIHFVSSCQFPSLVLCFIVRSAVDHNPKMQYLMLTTLAQHYACNGSTFRVCWVCVLTSRADVDNIVNNDCQLEPFSRVVIFEAVD